MRSRQTNERRGVILMVVLALLTLFAIIGITFVMYADSEATAARVARESETQQRPDMEPEQALALFLGQFIYDVPDTLTGVGSGVRGHSLARTMYGYNYTTPGLSLNANFVPFNGVGRLHFQQGGVVDDYTLVNYTWFSADPLLGGALRDPERFGTRTQAQLLASTQTNQYVGGNVPYTYPDLNNFFLAAVSANGQVLTPSFHRKWLFNPNNNFNDMTNPNWTNPQGKYLTLRPRPAEHPTFPLPDDATGDVKNLVWAPGGNDSIWIDIGAPVMTAKDGTQYKMLVAPLIIDLDGRINLNTAGNIVASQLTPTSPHVSNQGWGPWEVNLAKVLYGDQTGMTPALEYLNLFQGKNIAPITVSGRYVPGTPPTPTTAGAAIPLFPSAISLATSLQHFYAQADFNALNEGAMPAGSTPSSRPTLPTFGTPTATTCFPIFLQGYLNGGTENQNHPLLFDALRSQLPNGLITRVFRASDMEALLRPNSLANTSPVDSGSSALMSDLIRLCPTNFGPSANNPRYRNLVTALSADLGAPGVSPYWYNISGTNPTPNQYPVLTTPPYPNTTLPYALAPAGSLTPPFPPVTAGQPLPNIANNLAGMPLNPSEFGSDWRALSAIWQTLNTSTQFTTPTGRIRLNRPLPPYPHMGSGLMPPYGPPVTGAAYGTAYNTTAGNPIYTQYQAALTARQTLANDIYRCLLAITGVQQPAFTGAGAAPTPQQLAPLRWLAQLAVNIVDYIDEDDINTPFNFYTVADGLPAAQIGLTQGMDDNGVNAAVLPTGANPVYWVFGTELPKVVLNEVLAEAQNPNPAQAAVAGESVNVWLELYNTMPSAVVANTQPQDSYRVPLYMTNPTPGGTPYSPYRITISQTLMNQPPPGAPAPAPGAANYMPDTSANVLGKAYLAPTFPQSTTDQDFSGVVPLSQAGGATQVPFPVPGSNPAVTINAGVDAGNYFLIGPAPAPPPPPYQTNPLPQPYQDPFVVPGLPQGIPVLRTPNVTYAPTAATWPAGGTNDERTTGLTVLLRRLANPYLPLQPDPTQPNYNPYLTVDYMSGVPIRSNTPNPPAAPYASRGKCQPYGALTILTPPVAPATVPNAASFQPFSPVVDQQPNATPPPPGAVTTNNVINTFGMQNFPLPPSGQYTWLTHLDRAVISPMELLHVSGYQPYQLTQRFILGSDNLTNAANMVNPPNAALNIRNLFGHYVPWLDGPTPATVTSFPWWFDSTLAAGQSHRLSRLFEFLECGDRAFGVNGLGRIPGKPNINTIWDPEVLQALIDANSSIGINAMPSQFPPNAADPVVQIFNNLIRSRSPNSGYNLAAGAYGGTVGPVNMGSGNDDRPFLPLSAGAIAPGTATQFPNGINTLTDTLLRLAPAQMGQAQLLLFQNPTDAAALPAPNPPYVHPYLQTQLLTKLYNNVTTRSNTFAVFLTVGFFQVIQGGAVGAPNIPQLGPEIGRAEGRQVRHRMFAIIDRTNLTVATTTFAGTTGGTAPPNIVVTSATGPQTLPVTFGAMTGVNPNTGASWTIAAGSTLVFEPGTDNEETVVLQAGAMGQVQATFLKSHAAGVTVTLRGNPGPWITRYDPRLDPLVVPYYSIID